LPRMVRNSALMVTISDPATAATQADTADSLQRRSTAASCGRRLNSPDRNQLAAVSRMPVQAATGWRQIGADYMALDRHAGHDGRIHVAADRVDISAKSVRAGETSSRESRQARHRTAVADRRPGRANLSRTPRHAVDWIPLVIMSPTPAVADIVPKVTTKPDTFSLGHAESVDESDRRAHYKPGGNAARDDDDILPGKVDAAAMVWRSPRSPAPQLRRRRDRSRRQ